MPLSMSPVSLVAIGVASIAAYLDLRYRRIPNWLTVGALAIGLLLHGYESGLQGVFSASLGAGLGLAVLLPFYVLRGVGAGDVKLLAGLGALFGPSGLIGVALLGALVGGVMSLVALAVQRRLVFAIAQLASLRLVPSSRGVKLPYGVAIASGVYLSLLTPALIA